MATPQLENVADVYPLTPMQQGMLFHALADTDSSVFVNQMITHLEGALDVDALRAATERLVAGHPVLRTAFIWDGLEQPLQVVRDEAELEWVFHDWRDVGPDELDERIERFLSADSSRGFDLSDAPLSRVAVVRTGDESWLWVWTTHHLIADGWSMRVMLEQLFADLRGEAKTGEGLRFRDFVAMHASRDEQADEDYWRSLLSGFSEPHRLEVPGYPAEGDGYGSHTVAVDAATSTALRDFAREQRVTLNTVFLGAWSLVLSRWMRTRDVVFGVTTSGRDAGLPGVEDAVGLFINTLPNRVDVDGTAPVGDWLRRLQQAQVGSRKFEHSSLAAVQRWSDVAPGTPLFESIYVFENLPETNRDPSSARVKVTATDFNEHSNYPLAVLVHPTDEIEVQLIHDRARLSPAAVEAIAQQITQVVGQLPASASSRVARISLTSDADRKQLMEWV